MNYLKIYENFKTPDDSGKTSNYDTPKFVIQPYKDDTGFELVRQKYHRFLWTVPTLGEFNNGSYIDAGEDTPKLNFDKKTIITEDAYHDKTDTHSVHVNTADITRKIMEPWNMETGDTVGYKPNNYLPTDDIEDPDEVEVEKNNYNKLKRMKDFEEFTEK